MSNVNDANNGPVGGSGDPWSWNNFNPFRKANKQEDNINNDSNDNNDPNKDPNKKNNIDPNKTQMHTLWENEPEDPNKKKPNDPPPNNPAAPPNPKDELKRHLDEVGLGDLTLTQQELDAFKNGDNIADVLGKVNQRIQTGYLKAMSNISTVMEKKIEAAVTKAVQQSASMFEGERLRDILYEALPFTRNPAIGPIAETVLQRWLSKGKTKTEAVELTKQYFNEIRKGMDPDWKGDPNPNTRTGYKSGSPPPGDAQGKPAGENSSWLDVLKGNAESRAG